MFQSESEQITHDAEFHPSCKLCNLTFANQADLDTHNLSHSQPTHFMGKTPDGKQLKTLLLANPNTLRIVPNKKIVQIQNVVAPQTTQYLPVMPVAQPTLTSHLPVSQPSQQPLRVYRIERKLETLPMGTGNTQQIQQSVTNDVGKVAKKFVIVQQAQFQNPNIKVKILTFGLFSSLENKKNVNDYPF